MPLATWMGEPVFYCLKQIPMCCWRLRSPYFYFLHIVLRSRWCRARFPCGGSLCQCNSPHRGFIRNASITLLNQFPLGKIIRKGERNPFLRLLALWQFFRRPALEAICNLEAAATGIDFYMNILLIICTITLDEIPCNYVLVNTYVNSSWLTWDPDCCKSPHYFFWLQNDEGDTQ